MKQGNREKLTQAIGPFLFGLACILLAGPGTRLLVSAGFIVLILVVYYLERAWYGDD